MDFVPLPDWLLALVAAPFVGSFLGVVVLRLPRGQPIVFSRSSCPHCHRTLGFRDLLPLVSWAAHRGRCRYCSAQLGLFYPAIEMLAVLVAAWAAATVSGTLVWIACGLGWALLALAAIDLREGILPDRLTLPLLLAGLLATALLVPSQTVHHAIGAVVGFGAFAVIAWIYLLIRCRHGLGGGDIKLLAAAGAWVSWHGLPAVVLLAAVAALVVTLARAFRGKFELSTVERIRFGPYLCLGIWCVWLYGPLEFTRLPFG